LRHPAGGIPRINIGGGEPTLHPDLFDILSETIEFCQEHGITRPWMVTNGKRTERALALATMAEEGLIQCGLSQDRWHESVAPEVVRAFSEGSHHSYKTSRKEGDGRFIQKIGKPIYNGRAKDHPDIQGELRYCCNGCYRPWILPEGSVAQCGCDDSPKVGDVFKGFSPINNEWMCAFGKPRAHELTKHLNPSRHPGLVTE
jgi:hypothetical protein